MNKPALRSLRLLCKRSARGLYLAGQLMLAAFSAQAATLYVDLNSPAPTAPYATWATAATNIQDAVDAATTAGSLVLVSNGIYQSEARLIQGVSNRLVVTKPIIVQSVNGPDVTIIKGYQFVNAQDGQNAVRCAFLGNESILSGFTLQNGSARPYGDREQTSGGGAWCEPTAVITNCVLRKNTSPFDGGAVFRGILVNCTLTENTAFLSGGAAAYSILNHCVLSTNTCQYLGGAGAVDSTLNDCVVVGNASSSSSSDGGGGALRCVLNRCTVFGNSAPVGGGVTYSQVSSSIIQSNSSTYWRGGAVYRSSLTNCTVVGNTKYGTLESTNYNCIVYYNGAAFENASGGVLNTCCTTFLPDSGAEGNFTNAPLFLDPSGSDLRLQSNSPCINAGLNAFPSGSSDFAGNPRISTGTVDVGAYEFQSPQSQISHLWLQYFGLPTDGTLDNVDLDGDSFTTWQEWQAGTHPTDPASFLHMHNPVITNNTILLSWSSVTNRTYFLESSSNSPSSYSAWKTNIKGLANTTTVSSNINPAFPTFYRVGVSR